MSICLAISDADWSLTKDVFAIVGSVATVIGVLVAAVLGGAGLNTWRKQITGQNNHDLALGMLAQLYKFEMELNTSRAPQIYAHEIKSEESEMPEASDGRFKLMELGFERRLDRISATFATLSAMSLRAKASWGPDVFNLLGEIKFLKEEYEEYVRLRLLCADPWEPDDEKVDHHTEIAMRRNVFMQPFGKVDEFGTDLNSAVKAIEVLLGQKMVK